MLFTDPARGEVDMVFQFEHVNVDQGRRQMGPAAARLLDLKATLGRWQAGLADVGWNSLYWDNHDQPRAVSRFGDDGEYRVDDRRRCWPPCSTSTGARRTCIRAKSSA